MESSAKADGAIEDQVIAASEHQNDNGGDNGGDRGLLEKMARFRRNPFNFALEISLFVRGIGWRGYQDVVGQPCFYQGYTERIRSATMRSYILRQRLLDLTERRLALEEQQGLVDVHTRAKRKDEIIDSLIEVAQDMVDNMMCKMENKAFLRGAFWATTQLLTRAYSGIHVSNDEVERLRAVAKVAASKGQSIIFLPRHTSHADYVALHLVCYRLGLTLPVVVAGDNLNFPLVGAFLQHTGAMWVRRSFEGDVLYTTLVQAYLDTMMQHGYNLECFIEGTRSRTGKLLGPKFGILNFLLDSVLSGRTEDAYICPVSLQYDRVMEVDSYVTELLGKPKEKENLSSFLSATSVLSSNYGTIECRFYEPWSVKSFIREQQLRGGSAEAAIGATFAPGSGERLRLLRTLGYRVLSNINDASVVMPTALVGTVLLTLRGRGVGKSELIRRVDWLISKVKANGGHVVDFHGFPTSFVVARALEVLGPKLVGTVDQVSEETYYAVDRFQLSFYRNMTIHLFIAEALIADGLYTKVKLGGGSANQSISEDELIERVSFLSTLFRGEFIFAAGQGLRKNLETSLAGLVRDDVLMASPQQDGTVTIGLSNTEREQGRENYDFYCFLIWPFVDAAWLGAVSLLFLVPPPASGAKSSAKTSPWVEAKKATNLAQLGGRTLYHQGDLSYFESINKEALQNAYTHFQEEGIILKSTKPPKDGRLWDFIERIAQFRREGKNRRDGAAVSRRVLALAARLNAEMFADRPVAVEEREKKQRRVRKERLARRTKL
ncbi:hypothetical protein DV736_g5579, partial [Chaetothyriales sp. CBS 134916]